MLTNGEVLLAGGVNGVDNGGSFISLTIVASTELYDPAGRVPANLVSITVTPATTASLPIGAAQSLVAVGTFSDNSMQVLTSATWFSSDTTVAEVSNDATNRGTVVGVGTGTATIKACTGSICSGTGTTTSGAVTVTP